VSLKGLVSFALGGSLLLFVLYLVVQSAQSPYSGLGPLMNAVVLGFATFLLLGLGLFLIIESAVASRKRSET